jgi:predicted house-cleaning noncanonical NTP pyrophosphatase (MazG superfamily)
MDKLASMFQQQRTFMELLHRERGLSQFPVDVATKAGQKTLKDISHDCMHELFEAVHLLKNSKNHRKTDVSQFSRDEFVEELCDALHFFVEICIFAGVSEEELFQAYMDKGDKNVDRIMEGY